MCFVDAYAISKHLKLAINGVGSIPPIFHRAPHLQKLGSREHIHAPRQKHLGHLGLPGDPLPQEDRLFFLGLDSSFKGKNELLNGK